MQGRMIRPYLLTHLAYESRFFQESTYVSASRGTGSTITSSPQSDQLIMVTKAGVWSVISRILHALLVLVLTAILLRSVYYAFSLLAAGPRTHITTQHEEFEDRADPDAFVEDPMNPRIPTAQEIVRILSFCG
ncbi:hypothetical protein BS50DRAFT_252481 [Corynespora cassiicola Philippines]|uniref:Uncharacterized protein n=1 Tax=Corynespora cassiicola Philippines TaxID=1448308 RepID=A0A2T2P464_CORCC|nr:hypothetical protein BS50DRAFT_252481 [Corynespora cassiicola Philippines]